MLVDDRHNWLMYGISISLILYVENVTILKILLILAVIVLMRWLLKKYGGVGSADINSLTWILYGYTLLDISYLGMFFFVFLFFELIYFILKVVYFKNFKTATPFYIVILGSFVVNNFIWGLYR